MRAMLTTVQRYHIRISRDTITMITRTGELVTVQHVPGLLRFVLHARILRFAWGQLRDRGAEVIYLFDETGDNFGYAVNLDDPYCSGWGYAPFGVTVEQAV